jgi:hypothetical protein
MNRGRVHLPEFGGPEVANIKFGALPTFEVIPPAPIGSLNFKAYLDVTKWQNEKTSAIVGASAAVTLGGVRMPDPRLTMMPGLGQDTTPYGSFNVEVSVDLHRYLVDAIESRRAKDLTGTLRLEIVLGYVDRLPQGVPCETQLKFSEMEWVDALTKSGYSAGWTVYIERARLEGWNEVAGHLSKARTRLSSRDPTGVLGDCRAAIRAAEKVVDADWKDISAQIDRGSLPEPPFPTKSQRTENLRKWILSMADTGGHSENYNATPEDAELVYGLTCDLLAYLSRKEAHAERSRKP